MQICPWCLAEGKSEPAVGSEDVAEVGTCRRHRLQIRRALRHGHTMRELVEMRLAEEIFEPEEVY